MKRFTTSAPVTMDNRAPLYTRAPLSPQLYTDRERAYVAVNLWRWETAKQPGMPWNEFIRHWIEAARRELYCCMGCPICSIIRCGDPMHWNTEGTPCPRGVMCVDYRDIPPAPTDSNQLALVVQAVQVLTIKLPAATTSSTPHRVTISVNMTRADAALLCKYIAHKVNQSAEVLEDGYHRSWGAHTASHYGDDNSKECACVSGIVDTRNAAHNRIYREVNFIPSLHSVGWSQQNPLLLNLEKTIISANTSFIGLGKDIVD